MLFQVLKVKDVQIDISNWVKMIRKTKLIARRISGFIEVSNITIQNLESIKNITP